MTDFASVNMIYSYLLPVLNALLFRGKEGDEVRREYETYENRKKYAEMMAARALQSQGMTLPYILQTLVERINEMLNNAEANTVTQLTDDRKRDMLNIVEDMKIAASLKDVPEDVQRMVTCCYHDVSYETC